VPSSSSSSPSPDSSDSADLQEQSEVLEWLEELVADRSRLAGLSSGFRDRLLRACGQLIRPDPLERSIYRKARKRKALDARRQSDESVLDRTGIRTQRLSLVYPTPEVRGDGPQQPGLAEGQKQVSERLLDARSCYVCKSSFHDVHDFYDALCPKCAAFNWSKRTQSSDMTGRVALLTGGRVKIGYQVGIKLLRAGARLIVTTRFPRDAAARYAREPDFGEWQDRLAVFGLDLRHTPSVEALCAHLVRTEKRLDVVINNACQTVRRPPGFYGHLMEAEAMPLGQLAEGARVVLADYEALRVDGSLPPLGEGTGASDLPEAAARQQERSPRELAGLTLSAALSQLALVEGDERAEDALFPQGRLDADLQQVDLRGVNSWRLPLHAVSTVELLEVTLVNAVAPFVLDARLKPLMMRTQGRDKHIVNVSAMEGQFYRAFKTDKHPHTNMAKAALNMLTRTSAPDYQRDGIHMNAVDTGWITDEDPHHITLQKRDEHGFHPPLDHVDAASRILDPVFVGLETGEHLWGQFLKDYKPAPW
jgi:NAD(P)-dependent dehydrogenase (short-subunit alcohol dehydrogenase family)